MWPPGTAGRGQEMPEVPERGGSCRTARHTSAVTFSDSAHFKTARFRQIPAHSAKFRHNFEEVNNLLKNLITF